KKLFLTSSFWNVVNEFIAFLEKDPKGLTVGFVPTAADPYNDKWFVEADKKALVDIGLKVKEIDIKNKTENELREEFKGADTIFVAGGNTFYLLRETRKSGFDKIAKELIEQGVVYVGSSAGAYLVCPTIEASTWKHHNSDHFSITDFTALNLVPFLITAHFKPEYADIIKEAALNCKYPIKILTDQQALAVEDEKVALVGNGDEVKL
ncbi:MAG: Type 1 glutamine amidotransferase-like domain-containing protein, partial [Candidatus Pacebacteria bacterium]|nr:Type 1 glutamine amidotransferase-like domain-containing protein [Candidatus Paceibacterota bacterium]